MASESELDLEIGLELESGLEFRLESGLKLASESELEIRIKLGNGIKYQSDILPAIVIIIIDKIGFV